MSFFGLVTPMLSYTRTGVSWLRDSASDTVPIEWEIKRARQMISDLKPEIETAARQIAVEKVQVARLEKRLDDTAERLAKSESDIQRLRDDLSAQNVSYTYAGRTYTSAQVKTDLSNRFLRHKTVQQTADQLRNMLDSREKSLASANERLEAMLNSRGQLEVEVENLQARLASLRVSQTASELHIDDSALSQTRQLLDDIAARIDVEEETMVVDEAYFGGINLDQPDDEDLMDDIAAYFGGDASIEPKSLVSIQLD